MSLSPGIEGSKRPLSELYAGAGADDKAGAAMRLGDLIDGLPERLADLPAALPAHDAAAFLGVSRDHLWSLVREDALPAGVEVIHLGRKVVFPTLPVLRSLGLLAPSLNGAEHGT